MTQTYHRTYHNSTQNKTTSPNATQHNTTQHNKENKHKKTSQYSVQLQTNYYDIQQQNIIYIKWNLMKKKFQIKEVYSFIVSQLFSLLVS